MIIGIPKEKKTEEYRVAITPSGVNALVKREHTVLIEREAGRGSGIKDTDFKGAGAIIINSPEELSERSDLILKVKEPLPEEYPLLKEGQLLFTYLHLAASQELTQSLLQRKIIGVAYETVELSNGSLPLLTPMSEVAGRMAPQEGAKYLERPQGGLGALLGGIPGVPPAKVVIIGGGTVGTNAAKIAAGMGADITIIDIDPNRLRYLDLIMPPNVKTLISTEYNIQSSIRDVDLVIIAVLIHGAKAPRLIKKEMLKEMKPGAVIVDVAIDQGGGSETSRPTTHKDPIYDVDGVIHYCVANMPGAVPRTSTYGLTNVTLPYVLKLADNGFKAAITQDNSLYHGVNLFKGYLTYQAVAQAFNLKYTPLKELI